MPTLSPLQRHLESLLTELADVDAGRLADYIPALAAQDPDLLGIALTTVDGTTYAAGDIAAPFTIQSISKPFTYALALTTAGFEAVDAAIDVEPSGEAYNEISLGAGTGRPANALINAGAIASTSMLPREGRVEALRSFCSSLAGRELVVDSDVAAQEFAAGHRNLALAHLMSSFGILGDDPIEATRDYCAACALEVTVTDLAMMAATLAAGGRHPRTGVQLIDPAVVQRVLSVMTLCGMYDDAGRWMVKVGLPGKSGVGGGILAVSPGQFGLAVFSPRLDGHGNSVRGIKACEALSVSLETHMMNGVAAHRSTIRAVTPLAQQPSDRNRPRPDRDALNRMAAEAQIIVVQGRLTFPSLELVLRELTASKATHVVLDVRRVTHAGSFVLPSLEQVSADYAASGRQLVLIDEGSVVQPGSGRTLRVFSRRRDATAWVEDRQLEVWRARHR